MALEVVAGPAPLQFSHSYLEVSSELNPTLETRKKTLRMGVGGWGGVRILWKNNFQLWITNIGVSM